MVPAANSTPVDVFPAIVDLAARPTMVAVVLWSSDGVLKSDSPPSRRPSVDWVVAKGGVVAVKADARLAVSVTVEWSAGTIG